MDQIISTATKRNWKKLQQDETNKLTSRANKRLSKKSIVPTEYFTNKDNIKYIETLVKIAKDNKLNKEDFIYSLAINLLEKKGIYNKKHVKNVLKECNYNIIPEITEIELPESEEDILGLSYQCLLVEGEKNKLGSYYTPKNITKNMVENLDFSNGQTFLDPCCGSGAFLLAIDNVKPSQLFGIDIDPIAVFIAKVNLLLKYKEEKFTPQIFCLDYLKCITLEDNTTDTEDTDYKKNEDVLTQKFTYIVTNPPWGAMVTDENIPPEITSKETYSCFFVRAFRQLQKDGIMRFLFPEAVLNVKCHKDIRTFILENGQLNSITYYDEMFSGVTTKYIDIDFRNKKHNDTIQINKDGLSYEIDYNACFETENRVFNVLEDKDIEIIQQIKREGKNHLNKSKWALGVVTGNNREKLKDTEDEGYEKIYTGKEIEEYTLKPAKKYIAFNRSKLQQVAKDEYYRAPEKLVYKFISNKLMFAYDNTGSLFLNSANILIPDVPSMSIKTVMAFLNSNLLQYTYTKMFGEIKVLKGNLMELPLPQITKEQDIRISNMVDEIMDGNNGRVQELQEEIYGAYNLNEEQVEYVENEMNRKLNK